MSVRHLDGLVAGRGPVRLTIDGGRIAAIEPVPRAPGRWIWPALLDIQVNGYASLDINADDVSPDVVTELVRTQWRRGVGAFCPTIITAPEHKIVHALRAVVEARAADTLVRHAIPCVHVEGPHISVDDGPRGAHDPAWIRPPDLAEFARWQDASDGLVGIVTLAPELPGAVGYIEAIVRRGTLAAIGHCDATTADVDAAAAAGARLSTHLGNACRAHLPRHPNHLWAQLADDRLTASLIADGDHLPWETFVAMVRAKGLDRVVLVSDSAALAGAQPGEYATPVGGSVTVADDGRLVLTGTAALAGSARHLGECVTWSASRGGLGVADAVRLASENPARVLGLADRGAIRVGAWADLTVLPDRDDGWLDVETTIVAGEVVHG